MSKYLVDTNILLSHPEIFDDFQEEIIIHSIILEEIDNIIHSYKHDDYAKYQARMARNKIKKTKNKKYSLHMPSFSLPMGWDLDKNDNKILAICKDMKYTLITNDLAMQVKAESIDVKWQEYDRCKLDYERYTGFKIVEMDVNDVATWYQNEVKVNKWDLKVNEYLLIKGKNEDRIIDFWVWTSDGFRHVSPKKIDSTTLGKIKLLDDFQLCLVDSLSYNPVTLVKGRAGTGKSLITAAYAMSMIESNKSKFDKLIVFANPVATKNSAKLGYYPGNKDEKLLDSQIGNMLASKFGNRQGVERLIQDGKLMLLPFSDIRGFDTTDMKAIIWVTESQNLDIELMRLAIQRVGDDCQLIIDGDYEAQIDCKEFEGYNNGMKRVSEIFRGQDFYGEIELQNVYRSKWADWANKL